MIEADLVRQLLQHRDLLFGFILALTRDAAVAEEVFQEVSMAVLEEAQRGARPDDFMAWARGLARHRVADYYRARSKWASRERALGQYAETVNQAFEEHADSVEGNLERLKFLRECLERLGRRARQIIHARYHQRLSLDQIAAAVSWKPDAVKVALSKSRRALGECVERKVNAAARGPS